MTILNDEMFESIEDFDYNKAKIENQLAYNYEEEQKDLLEMLGGI